MLPLLSTVLALQLHVKAGPDGRSVGDCPFAHAVRIVAGCKELEIDLRPHSPESKPEWLLEQHEGKMPCLVDGDEVVVESRKIAGLIDAHYPQPPLRASAELEAAEAVCQPVFGAFARFCKSSDAEADAELKKALLLELCRLDAFLAQSARPWTCGADLSMADAFLLPALYHVTVAGGAFKGFEIPPQFEALQAYMKHAFATPLLQATTPPEAMVRWGWASARADKVAIQIAVEELQMSDEVAKAHEAALARMPILAGLQAGDVEPRTIFDQILAKEIPSETVHDDELCYAFKDIAPQAPVHVLLIPKERAGLTQIRNAKDDHASLLGHMMVVAGSLGNKLCPDGFRLVINDGKQGAQSVYHLHIHILGGRQLGWPPG